MGRSMAWVLSETDYKRVTLLTKITGIFTFAAGTMMLTDRGNVLAFLILVPLGILVTLAPVPMTVMRPDTLEDDEGMLTLNE